MPNARVTDPQTSHDAAMSITQGSLTETKQIILSLFKIFSSGGLTDQELIQVIRANYGKFHSDSGLRSRRSELVAEGLIVDSQRKQKLDTGRNAIVWVISDAGREALR